MNKGRDLYLKKVSSGGSGPGIFRRVMVLVFVIFMTGSFAYAAPAGDTNGNKKSSVRIQDGEEWYYYKGVQKPPRKWNSNDFDHKNWRKGPSGIGYGRGKNRTYLGDMRGKYSTVYASRVFEVANPESAQNMNLTVACDGPFIAYLNGIEIIRTNTIQISDPDQPLSEQAEQFNLSGFVHELQRGENTLSVQCTNDDIDSEDFSFIPVFEVLESGEVQQ